jgi:homoserine O-acetyltransferase
VLQSIRHKTLLIGIENDLLCPLPELQLMADHIPGAAFQQINSLYGHDGFLTEHRVISGILSGWLHQ